MAPTVAFQGKTITSYSTDFFLFLAEWYFASRTAAVTILEDFPRKNGSKEGSNRLV
jgi:hypothetical protein